MSNEGYYKRYQTDAESTDASKPTSGFDAALTRNVNRMIAERDELRQQLADARARIAELEGERDRAYGFERNALKRVEALSLKDQESEARLERAAATIRELTVGCAQEEARAHSYRRDRDHATARAIAAEEREARLREVLRDVRDHFYPPQGTRGESLTDYIAESYAIGDRVRAALAETDYSALADAGAGNQSAPKGDDHLPQMEAESADSRADSPLGADDHNQTTPKNTPNSRAARGESEE